MSSLSKIVAGMLLVAGLVLAFIAWRLASAPASAPAAAASAPAPAAPVAAPVKRYPVVVAKTPIAAGTRIDAARMLEVAQWQAALSGGYEAAAPLEGAVAKVDIAAGDPMLPSLLAQGLARQLKEGERAVAIAVDEVVGGGNRIGPGDWVDVFFMIEKGQEVPGAQARLLQSQLRVLAYGKASVDGPEEKPAGQAGVPNQPAKTAVLAVPLERVNELMLASRAGRLQLALRPLGDEALPDTELFVQRGSVLPVRADLTPAQRDALKLAPNRAYAGESLVQLDGTTTAARTPAAVARGANAGGGRSVEIVRGDKTERVRY
ncbi:Flp pilus assembly protein CpaB [Achromobacter sp. HZ01]|jgi:pilus assembly protein CpaB|uniref:Flp pilus assembly protein CpaB n=1 Tax=Achromobacter pulmonis TaxID=1389932 RepID=A0A2N8KLP3_9BURK|nr:MULTISPECIES: Flp pilus assembly protein CpaB [Achromobacter]MBO9328886.1 Flp pilus assembly protein CpaB [Achromobacter xylosoxidans]PND34376.1 Flp pilus assembly protein CpaB [Achromobacter pulmonis]RAP64545.1 Flp pilus assembly protein CpaB [Achromobacter sp. HZ01]